LPFCKSFSHATGRFMELTNSIPHIWQKLWIYCTWFHKNLSEGSNNKINQTLAKNYIEETLTWQYLHDRVPGYSFIIIQDQLGP
jgi:hypothetical protein